MTKRDVLVYLTLSVLTGHRRHVFFCEARNIWVDVPTSEFLDQEPVKAAILPVDGHDRGMIEEGVDLVSCFQSSDVR